MTFSVGKGARYAYRTVAIASTLAAIVAGCRERKHVAPASSTEPAAAPSASLAASPAAQSPPPTPPAASSPAAAPSSAAAPAGSAPPLEAGVIDLGPAVAFTLSSACVAVRLGDEDLLVAPFKGSTPQPLAPFDATKVPRAPADFSSNERLSAYWVSRDRLVRRPVADDGSVGPLEVLTTDAAENRGVAAARGTKPSERDVVLYIGKRVTKDLERKARAWVEGQGAHRISNEAGGATAAEIVPLGGGRFALLTLDGRVGMSPLHATHVELDNEGKPHFGEDKVVYVAGPAEWHTAITGIHVGPGPIAFIPMSKDSTQFGLLSLRIGYEDEAPESWHDYPNGLDPAPVAVARICNAPHVAFVRPETSQPRSPQVIEVAPIKATGELGSVRRIGAAPSVLQLGLAPARGSEGGWLVYSTEQRLLARHVSCAP